MSEQQTDRWKGANEAAVINALGAYKLRTPHDDGYILHFDYSYAKRISKLGAEPSLRARVAASSTNYGLKDPGLVPAYNTNPSDRRYAPDSVIKYMDFFFTKTGNVGSVYSQGYPDSVYYVKRK